MGTSRGTTRGFSAHLGRINVQHRSTMLMIFRGGPRKILVDPVERFLIALPFLGTRYMRAQSARHREKHFAFRPIEHSVSLSETVNEAAFGHYMGATIFPCASLGDFHNPMAARLCRSGPCWGHHEEDFPHPHAAVCCACGSHPWCPGARRCLKSRYGRRSLGANQTTKGR